MKKADVIQRSSNDYAWRDPVPALKVKWSPFWPDIEREFRGRKKNGPLICKTCEAPKFVHGPSTGHAFKGGGSYYVHEFGDDEKFWEWAEGEADRTETWDYERGNMAAAEEMTRENGWEMAKELAAEVFGSQVKTWSSGRSGGWLIVEGLPDVESWDAIALSRWARFARGVQEILDDLDYQFVWHLHVNVYEANAEAFFA